MELRTVARLVGVAAFVVVACAVVPARGADNSAFTPAQATRGQDVFVQYCVTCHGAQLQGGEGPPLQGAAFGNSLATGRMTTASLYTFIRGGMPMNAPGSLTPQQYLDVLAFILSRNGYPAGGRPLSAPSLRQVALLPFPRRAAAPAAPLTAAPQPAARVPSSAKVALDDGALGSASRDANDWLLPGRTYDNQRYSPLTQITTANVGRLVPVASVHTGMFASFETTPLVADGVMYLTTPVVDHAMVIMAVDAATGATLWRTSYAIGPFKDCCGPNNRGPALAYGNLYVTTMDAKVVAFDARTGAERWETRVADPRVGYSESMAPQPYRGEIIVGSAGGEWAVRGFVAAYDARTGKQRWRWYTTDPATFAGDSWKRGGGTVWTTPAIDQQRGLVVFGVGNPNPDLDGSVRAGDNRYTDSIVALDARTGRLRWYYQEVKHDRWDYDAASNVVLFEVRSGGRTIPCAGEAGKVGWFFIVDRTTGKLVRRSAPYVRMNRNMFAMRQVLPGANGGSEWSPPAYSPRTHDAYVLGINQLMDFKDSGASHAPGFIDVGSVFTNTVKPKIQTGTFSAIDTQTGAIAWQHTTSKPLIGGALATAGDVVFVGEGTGALDAFDARNGRLLWHHTFPAGVDAPPISYAVGSVQYVAVAVGGNFQLNYPRGDLVAIFKLRR
ncbi:MAG: PQQ-binding-like beta-propeller repeat protein [Vulcanimicrobiaceae bacterium]